MDSVRRFEELQRDKVRRAKRLMNVLVSVTSARISGEREVVKQGLSVLSSNHGFLVELLNAQVSVCGDLQCRGQLADELHVLTGKNKELGMSVVDHVRLAAKGGELNADHVRRALSLIIAREESLVDLLRASLKY